MPSQLREATRQRERYHADEAYRELRRKRAKEYYSANRELICRRTYLKLVEAGAIKNPRQLERYKANEISEQANDV
jgi:hypothetical protein